MILLCFFLDLPDKVNKPEFPALDPDESFAVMINVDFDVSSIDELVGSPLAGVVISEFDALADA